MKKEQQIERLTSALQTAKATIRAWHSMGYDIDRIEQMEWDLYQNSPEMEIINEALKL